MPLFFRNIHEEDLARFMFRHGILKFLGHHFYPEEPSGITMGSIAIHRILIGKLFKGSACGGFLYNDFLETVNLGNG